MKTQSILLFFAFIIPLSFLAQDKVLIFTKTNGFTHPSIDEGVTMIKDLGNQNGLWSADDSGNSNVFTESNLSQYKAVVFCNTSGNNLLNASQRQAFENFIANGGGFVGIHAATDTYRDRSWPFYNELVGGIVQTNPNHTRNNFNATMTVVNSHPSVDFLGNTWTKREEYYYWRNNGGQLFNGNITLLEVESTGNNNYDEARPISWFKEYGGGRSFYTALGHNASDYTDNNNFIKHVEEGIKYVIGNTLSVGSYSKNDFNINILQNPVQEVLAFSISNRNLPKDLYIYNINGQLVHQEEIDKADTAMNVSYLSKGLYLAKLVSGNKEAMFKFVKR